MDQETPGSGYPRPLTKQEAEWIAWILPNDSSGYREWHNLIRSMSVIGEGRRGEGEIILSKEPGIPDFGPPLPPVLAYGMIENDFGSISITLREPFDGQVSLEIVSHAGRTIPDRSVERRRWTYSTWFPGQSCPQCSSSVREIPMITGDAQEFVLAVCSRDRRIWVYEKQTGINKLIPVTNFYNELMLHKNIRDPKIALDHKRLFSDLGSYSNADLKYAFSTYNTIMPHLRAQGGIVVEQKKAASLLQRLTGLFRTKTRTTN